MIRSQPLGHPAGPCQFAFEITVATHAVAPRSSRRYGQIRPVVARRLLVDRRPRERCFQKRADFRREVEVAAKRRERKWFRSKAVARKKPRPAALVPDRECKAAGEP